MNGRKKINENHPDYPKALEKFRDIQRRMGEELSKTTYQGGLDGPADDIHRKYSKELDKLMVEYSYLYTEED